MEDDALEKLFSSKNYLKTEWPFGIPVFHLMTATKGTCCTINYVNFIILS